MMTAESTTKRRRIVTSQSKNGCYTCRARRIKCDERRPTCLRCERSKQSCLGYREQELSDDDEKQQHDASCPSWQSALTIRQRSSTNPRCALSYRLAGDSRRDRFASLAADVLQSGDRSMWGRSCSVWAVTLPRFSYSVPVVAFALAALGSAMESSFIDQSTSTSGAAPATTAKLYGAAVAEMQSELSYYEAHSERPREYLLLACGLLGCADIVQWREVSAMTHVQGAFALLRGRRRTTTAGLATPCSTTDSDKTSLECEEETFTPIDDLDLFFVQLDLQTASYALGLPPRLPSLDLRSYLAIPRSERQYSDLELEVTQAVHYSYRAAHMLSEYNYTGRDRVPNDLAFQQARCIAQLLACLSTLSKHINNSYRPSSSPTDPPQRTTRILRTQCLAALIYLSMRTHGPECEYDAYASFFEQIVLDATQVLSEPADQSIAPLSQHFSIGLGILQTLFLTATKYRDPTYRRRAISLLSKGGREGPWHGKMLAAVSSRAVEIEESSLRAQGLDVAVASDVPERARLHGIALDTEGASLKEGAVRVDLNFSRCWDVHAIPFSAKGHEDESHWDMWTERLGW